MRALASASVAKDGAQVASQIPSIAQSLASKKEPEGGEQLCRELLTLIRTWSVDNTYPLIQGLHEYARFLIGQKDRLGEAPAAIERYRESLAVAQGAETSALHQVMRLRIELARATGAQVDAMQSADELLAFEESLSGTTSARYMRAAQSLTHIYQSGGNPGRALPLHRQIVAIADLTLRAGDEQRGQVRINAALAFANERQFDEADRLAGEAVAIGDQLRPPRTDYFVQQLNQIRRMKAAAESGAGPASRSRRQPMVWRTPELGVSLQ